jgi:hypothetical protein
LTKIQFLPRMLPFTVLVHSTNAVSSSSPPKSQLSLTHLLENTGDSPLQSSFNRHARLPSLVSNICLWLTFILAIAVLQANKQDSGLALRLIYGLIMSVIIVICYLFILFESKGCTEQILLKKRIQVDVIKGELGSIQKNPKLTTYLKVTATNYYNSFTRQYIDYRVGANEIALPSATWKNQSSPARKPHASGKNDLSSRSSCTINRCASVLSRCSTVTSLSSTHR